MNFETSRIIISDVKSAPKAYIKASPPTRQNILEFECRGLEFVEFKPDGHWQCKGEESGTKFTGINLTEGEFFEYDEKAGEEVSIQDIKWEIRRT